uniref:Uncharacterized protein n=1 Tax=Prolemur simus TaxID=1328070 RepID=A0A8C9DM09_PROSS
GIFVPSAIGQSTTAVSTTTDTASSSPISTNIAYGNSSPEASTTTMTISSSPLTAPPTSSPTSAAGPSTTPTSTAPSASSPTSAASPSTTPTSTASSASSSTSAASPSTTTSTASSASSPTSAAGPSTTPTSTAPSSSSLTSAAGPSTTPTSTPADSESTTVTTIAVSFTDDTSAITVSSLPTQSNSETSPITKNNSLVITSTKPQSSGTSTNNPCASNSACVKLYDTHFCLCSEGYYYHFSACLKGKTFPGKIAIKVSETVGLEDQTSLAYQGLYTEIVGFVSIFQLSFCISIPCSNTELRSVDASPSSSARSEVRAGDEVVTVTIVNILTLDTNGTQETVSALIKSAINGTNITDYILQDRCDYYGCVKAEDDCVNNLACTCKEGWERLNPQVAFCFGNPECPENCSGEHRRCLIKEDESPECACEPGNFCLIPVTDYRSRNKEKNIEEQNLIEEDFQNLRLRPTGFSNLGAQGRMFPKIRVAGSRDSLSPNPYAQADMPHPDY